MVENNKVGVFGLVRASFEQEAKAIPQEQVDKSFNKVMAELNKRKEADRPTLDSEIEKCASIADKQAHQTAPLPTKNKDNIGLDR